MCADPNGNRLLRSLEPPRHDKWDARREGEPGAVIALAELKAWIRNTLKDQIPHLAEVEFNETNLPPELQEDEEPENPVPEGENSDQEPDLGGRPKESGPTTPTHRPIVARKKSAGKKGVLPGHGDVIDPKKGDGKKTGGRPRRNEGGGGGERHEPRPAVRTRAFPINSERSEYEIIIRTDRDYTGPVLIEAVGDNGAGDSLPLSEVVCGNSALASPIRDN